MKIELKKMMVVVGEGCGDSPLTQLILFLFNSKDCDAVGYIVIKNCKIGEPFGVIGCGEAKWEKFEEIISAKYTKNKISDNHEQLILVQNLIL